MLIPLKQGLKHFLTRDKNTFGLNDDSIKTRIETRYKTMDGSRSLNDDSIKTRIETSFWRTAERTLKLCLNDDSIKTRIETQIVKQE